MPRGKKFKGRKKGPGRGRGRKRGVGYPQSDEDMHDVWESEERLVEPRANLPMAYMTDMVFGFRMAMCPSLHSGSSCPFGEDLCFYSHEQRALRRVNSVVFQAADKCTLGYGDPTQCRKGHKCVGAHCKAEMNFSLAEYKQHKCREFAKNGSCGKGVLCANYHLKMERMNARRIERRLTRAESISVPSWYWSCVGSADDRVAAADKVSRAERKLAADALVDERKMAAVKAIIKKRHEQRDAHASDMLEPRPKVVATYAERASGLAAAKTWASLEAAKSTPRRGGYAHAVAGTKPMPMPSSRSQQYGDLELRYAGQRNSASAVAMQSEAELKRFVDETRAYGTRSMASEPPPHSVDLFASASSMVQSSGSSRRLDEATLAAMSFHSEQKRRRDKAKDLCSDEDLSKCSLREVDKMDRMYSDSLKAGSSRKSGGRRKTKRTKASGVAHDSGAESHTAKTAVYRYVPDKYLLQHFPAIVVP